MTLATFFRDPKVKDAMTSPKRAQASGVIAAFFERYDYGDCSGDQLLALADLGLRCKDFTTARTALDRAIESGGNAHLAFYKRGRLDMALGDHAAAADSFARGTEASPDWPFNWMGRAQALFALGQKAEAAVYGERFAAFGVRPHGKEELVVLADLADVLFIGGHRPRSRPLYELVRRFGSPTPKHEVRLAEAYLALRDPERALDILDGLGLGQKLDIWGRRAWAHCLSRAGQHARAVEIAEALALERPGDQRFTTTYVEALIGIRDAEVLRDALTRNGVLFDTPAAGELGARLSLLDGELEDAATQVLGLELAPKSRVFHLAVSVGYAALAAGREDLALRVAAALKAADAADIFSSLIRIDILFLRQQWEDVADLLRDLPAEDQERPHVLLKRFELASFTGNTAQASALLERVDGSAMPSPQFMLPVFRFLAEQHRWDELIDRVPSWLDNRFTYGQIGYVFFRAAKHTRRHGDLVAAVEAVEGWQEVHDLVRLRSTLLVDRASTLEEVDALIADKTLLADPILRRRLEVTRDVLSHAAGQVKKRALFLCTNPNYLCATVVALHSALRAMNGRDTDIFIVVDDDLADQANRFVRKFADEGYNVRIVAAAEVVDSAAKLYAGYGLFTSGHMLASAAYYRIFFAKYLQKTGLYDRAVYVDSDVLIRGSLDQLFAADLNGAPLSARIETSRPEVRRAIEMHKLEGDMYFNSGVLVFDLKHDDLGLGIDGAVTAIADDDVTLLFHDQCALNVGFRGRFKPLDMDWNFPVGASDKLADLPDNPGILHFLDRPKPWSAAYSGEAALLWYEEWRATAAFIGEGLASELFRLAQD